MPIKTFKSKALSELWLKGRSAKMDARLSARALRRLDLLNAATEPDDMNKSGCDFHRLEGFRPPRYTVHINGPWCITFEFAEGNAYRIDLEQYH